MERNESLFNNTRFVSILWVVIAILAAVAIWIFRPCFYENTFWLFAIFEVAVVTPFAIMLIGEMLYMLFEPILERILFKEKDKNIAVAYMIAFVLLMWYECYPRPTDYLYYVNVYSDSETSECEVGYVNLGVCNEYKKPHYYVEEIFFADGTSAIPDECNDGDIGTAFETESHRRYKISYECDEYDEDEDSYYKEVYIEFLKPKKD